MTSEGEHRRWNTHTHSNDVARKTSKSQRSDVIPRQENRPRKLSVTHNDKVLPSRNVPRYALNQMEYKRPVRVFVYSFSLKKTKNK